MGTIRSTNGQKAAYNWEEMTPVAGNIIVKWRSEPLQTVGGLYRPDAALRWEIDGEVLRLGKKPPDAKCELSVGDKVYANPLWGTLVFEGEEEDSSGAVFTIQIKIIGWSDVMATMRA
jgi:co-chaperonin GroES (HSP10)